MNDEVLETMAAHVTVRRFLPDPVPDDHVRRCVAAAQRAATSSWIQAYGLLEVESPDERARLAELCGGQDQVRSAGRFFVVCADSRRHRSIAVEHAQPYAGNLEAFLLAVIDASLFAQNLTLAFEALGYGTCYIGGLRNRLAEVAELLELPYGVYPLYGLCAGVAADEAREAAPRPRLPVEAVWMRGRYPSEEDCAALRARHDEESARYYADRGQKGRSWSGGVARTFRQPNREHLADFFRSQGASFD